MNPRFKIKDILKEPLYIHKIEGNEETYNETIINALKDVKINTDFMEVYPHMLSGGQRQRLALARALLHDSPVYIFDEATSNIDVESENKIMEVIHEMAKQKTVLLISHRLANVVDADAIYVMRDGVMAEQGKHESLMAEHGYYYDLFMTQQVLERYTKEAN